MTDAPAKSPGYLVGELIAAIDTEIRRANRKAGPGRGMARSLLILALDRPSLGIPRIFQAHGPLFSSSPSVEAAMCQFEDSLPGRLSQYEQSKFWIAYYKHRING